MVHWPKTIVGNVVTIAVTFIVGLALVQSAIALSGTIVWISIAVTALVVFVAVVVHRRAQAASDLALADAPSFADVPLSGTAAGISRRRGWSGPSSARVPSRPRPPRRMATREWSPSFRCSPRSSEDEAQNSEPVSVNRTASPAATKNPHSASEAPSSATFR
jgi:hypothetical protein